MSSRALVAVLAALTITATVANAQVDIRTSSCPSIIREGQTGACVSSLQSLLNNQGAGIAVDGDFGPATLSAVKSFQSRSGLTADGLVGPDTKNALYAAGSPAPPASSGVSCTATEFANAISSCGFRAQPDSKRVNMLASIQRLGGSAVISSKRELAMWMAQIIHESVGLSTISEIGGSSASYAPYYGRGYIQLTGKSNYQSASTAIYGDSRLVSNPDLVTSNDNIAFDVSTYYWKTRVHNLSGVQSGQFGRTTVGINGGECTAYPARACNRCTYYRKVLVAFNINEVANCAGCANC
eukprot:CAMPEP_0206138160 /NCGR_PEP_ID=MMETSP1473-20131121/3128_1 /ASSEMBLY_ACC=CAM_ASM_001109 /TAXON_ID=1461547 /ORGANISM="Stichococcus sp, Strain RCC1054" /LENGTH=296 /DNA_ID=CAMNT_0053531517 /DNA_START=154 /DNA_END=1044 /DNA_ORIENTATION=-